MYSSNFDWSIEIMDPGRSLQKEHEETPGTNWFAGRQLAADYPCQGDFRYPACFSNVQCVHGGLVELLSKFQRRAGSKENLSSKRDTAVIDSELRWKDRYTSLL